MLGGLPRRPVKSRQTRDGYLGRSYHLNQRFFAATDVGVRTSGAHRRGSAAVPAARHSVGRGLLLGGIIIGPHGLDMLGTNRPIADFLGEMGKLLLMFVAGLEIDMAQFRRQRTRSLRFGFVTTILPLLLGTGVGLLLGYGLIPSIVLGSLLASHTLLGFPILVRLGKTRLESVTVTTGATILSDTLSLVVFAVCVTVFQSGFAMSGLVVQIIELAIFFPLIVVGLGRLGSYALGRAGHDETAYFVLMLAILAVAGVIAQAINLPGIVGAFLAGLAVNATVHNQPAKEKIEFFGNAFFIPVFFIVTGFLINPAAFFQSITENFLLVIAVVGALVGGKWLAAEMSGRAFGYTRDERLTVWSLTLPQVAATLAAALVAYHTLNPAGERLVDAKLLNVVLVLVLTTSILGPVLTERFAPRLPTESPAIARASSNAATRSPA